MKINPGSVWPEGHMCHPVSILEPMPGNKESQEPLWSRRTSKAGIEGWGQGLEWQLEALGGERWCSPCPHCFLTVSRCLGLMTAGG